MWAGFGVMIVAGMIYAAKRINDYVVNKPEQRQRRRDNTDLTVDSSVASSVTIRRGLDSDISELINSLNREFKCGISCIKVKPFISPNYNTEYTVNGKKYVGYQTLQGKKIGTSENKHGCDCDRISIYQDRYGNKVILLIQDIPCFDSGDREYDSAHLLYLFHNNGQIHALYCGEGYRIATLTLFENITISNKRLKSFLKSEGFPVSASV